MRRGFTVIELLVVLGIIMLIAGLAIPALKDAKEKQKKMKEEKAKQQQKAIDNKKEMGTQDYQPPTPGFKAQKVVEPIKVYMGTLENLEVKSTSPPTTVIHWNGGKTTIIPAVIYGEFKFGCVYTLYKTQFKSTTTYELRY